jgi:hypothetical protein
MKKITLPKEIELFFSAFRKKVVKRYEKFVAEEPIVKEELIGKLVHQLRRDFPIEVQNDVILSVSRRLNDMRDVDQVKMETELEKHKEQTSLFKSKILC